MLDTLVHERTLLGALDSFLAGVVHVRPYLAGSYRDQLEAFAEGWLAAGGANQIDSISPAWLAAYFQTASDRAAAEEALRQFYDWAVAEGLTEHWPLTLP